MIFDFVIDAKRYASDGTPVTFEGEYAYTMSSAMQIICGLFPEKQITLSFGNYVETYEQANPPYTLECNLLVFTITKLYD